MKSATGCLQTSDIEAMLAGAVPASQNELWEEHFSTCESCRRAMANQIGDQQWWQDAEQSLQHVGESLGDSQGSKELVPQKAQQKEHRLGETELREFNQRESVADLIKLLGPTDDPQMLGRIGSYEVLEVLGRGGMGIVFKAFDAPLNRFVAIKMLLPHLAASGAARQRFAREGQAVAAVVDDHVMAIHCVDEWQGVPYLVMTYSRGVSLQKRLSDNGPLEVREILRIGMQAAKGLAAAHAQGIVHRDIKPANIFLDQNVERVQLMDFGLARAVDDASLTRSGTLAGTPQYMSPEQARAETVDHRSDLFSLGSVMYAMCTGHAPFRAESSYSVLRLITDKEPRPIREINPDVPEWLCAIISKLMAKKADDRFVSAREVADLLEDCLAHVQQPLTKPLPAVVDEATSPARHAITGTRGLVRNRKRITAIAAAIFLCFAGVLFVLESKQGTLTIESDADDVPIRIMHGDEIVKSLVIDREGATTQLHAGEYTLEIDDPNARYDVTNNQVIISRGTAKLVKITYQPADQTNTLPLGPRQRLFNAVIEFNNLHPSDAKGKPMPPLTHAEFLSVVQWKMGNDKLSDELVKAIQSIFSSRDQPLPAGWRFVGGQIVETCPQGVIKSWQIKLDTNGLSKPLVIRKSAIALATDQAASELPQAPDGMVSLESLVEQFNATHQEIERQGHLPHEIFPLTTDEVLAALAWSDPEQASSPIGDKTAKSLLQILATHHLPPGTKLELVPSIENAIGQRFSIERIVLLMPDADESDKVESIIIRNHFIGQDNHPAATHWSRPGSNGLQVGVRLSPAEQTYRHGQVVDIEFLYRSVFTQPVPATLPAAFQFSKIRGIRLERVSFVKPTWPDGSRHTLIGSEPVVVKGHRMQICFDSDEELKPGVNLRAITRPDARHYVYFTVPNPGDESIDERLEIRERLYFSIPPLTPPKVLPLYESHYYRHWGFSVPGHRRPEQSTPDPTYIDPFQIGVSLSPAEKSRIPAYYASGFRVDKVAPHSPAEKVGIEVGDILLSWERNQFYGDDPTKPFANYKSLDNQLREFLENHSRPLAFGSGNMKFDLLDHRSGEIVHISPWFGDLANGGPNKAEILKRMAERKQLREQSE